MKHLVVGGCSFSDGTDDWPTALVNRLENYTLHNTARGSSGNEMISRRVIHKVNDLLKQESADNIIVGIMWSGSSRNCFYANNKKDILKVFAPHGKQIYKKGIQALQDKDAYDLHSTNPHMWPEEDTQGAWLNATVGMNYLHNQKYIELFHDDTLSVVRTLEHVLRTQWYLESKNINYFMVPYMKNWILETDRINTVQVNYLLDMIDYDKWLPIVGEYEWVKENAKSPWRNKYKNDLHPSEAQHEDFVNEVVMPWLKKKKYAS